MVVIVSGAKNLQPSGMPTIRGTPSSQLVAYGSIFSFDPVLHSVIGFSVRTS